MRPTRYLLMAMVCVALAGCDEETADPAPDPIRAIKHATLDQRAGLQARKIAGIVAADITTSVAFETNGQVVELLRKAGDEVAEGQLIARLDDEPLTLALAQAEAELVRANATAEDARKKHDQQKQLLDQGFATRSAFDTALSNFKNAEGAVDVAQSVLDRARRDLAKAELRAPFAGVISRRSVDVFQEVTGGQEIYSMQTAGKGKVEAALPETMVNQITLGTEVEIVFPPIGDTAAKGRVDEISPLTGDANAYPIKVVLDSTPAGLRAGMSAELTFRFATEATGKAFLVPLAAVLPRVGAIDEASVFIYDPASKTVAQRPVTIANVENNSLEVIGDLKAGEIIAVAGVSFLHDGMRVDLFDPESLR